MIRWRAEKESGRRKKGGQKTGDKEEERRNEERAIGSRVGYILVSYL